MQVACAARPHPPHYLSAMLLSLACVCDAILSSPEVLPGVLASMLSHGFGASLGRSRSCGLFSKSCLLANSAQVAALATVFFW